MTEYRIPARSEIPQDQTWNAESVFATPADWQAAYAEVEADLVVLEGCPGRLAQGPAGWAEVMDAIQATVRRAFQVLNYAVMAYQVDTTDQDAGRMAGKAQSLLGRVQAAMAFLDPELLAVGQESLALWMAYDPELALYAHYVDNLFRKQAHVRSAEVEELLGLVADPFYSIDTTADMLTNADFTFRPAQAEDGRELPVSAVELLVMLSDGDRSARRTAWESHADTYLAFKNTLASNLVASVKCNVFYMRARRYDSTLQASLFEQNIPVAVYYNLIDTFRKHLPTWHRYWRLRRRALGVETLQPYDVWAPLRQKSSPLTFAEAVGLVCKGLAPLGEDYVSVMRKGCLEERWVDIPGNKGKTSGAFSAGSPGTHPFIVMSFRNDILSLSTLAHELGHSMHSYLAWRNQPTIYSDYSLFVAEVASNFHQAMLRDYLLEHETDPSFRLSVIEEAMSNFYRYFFVMPTLARFELEVHTRIEQGQGVTADDMSGLMADLFAEGYGGEMGLDRPRVGMTWATFSHLYADYYVYQYATGISGAHALARRILDGEDGAVDDYLRFLRAGNSVYPLDALKMAGVDLTTPQPVEETFAVLSGMVDRLEDLLGLPDDGHPA